MDVADPIPPSVKALVELFKNELSAVTFPGVDGAILEQLIDDVRNYTDAVIKAEAALEAARTSLRESEEVLAVKSQKALAYARVYAEDRPEIATKVDVVARIAGATPTSSAPPARDRDPGSDAPKRRGRQKKVVATEATDATPAAPVVEAAADSNDMTPAAPGVMDISVEEVDASVLDGALN
jgi:hypothetical protein